MLPSTYTAGSDRCPVGRGIAAARQVSPRRRLTPKVCRLLSGTAGIR